MDPALLTTRFADPERSTTEQTRKQNRRIVAEPLVQSLLDGFPEAAMLINRHRQIVLANDKLAILLDRSRESLLGMRPGEALACEHSAEEPSGCGTSEFCRACGAVRAILNCQESNRADSQECNLLQSTPEGPAALDLRVFATPIVIGGEAFTIFAMRDITDENRRRVLERLFFHDLLNAAGGLRGILEIWPELSGEEALEMSRTARGLSEQLIEEILSQRDLAAAEQGDLMADAHEFDAARLVVRLCILYSHHTVAEGKRIAPPVITGETTIRADEVILGRILGNLITNALEASQKGQSVSVTYSNDGSPAFSIHNDAAMSEEARLQIFKRSFSTKGGRGRGIGSYSVKLLTERYLKGTVTFESNAGEGTTFTIRLP